ncbi:MAG: methyltransferase domain-containing protein [Pseudomonadota bacterium]
MKQSYIADSLDDVKERKRLAMLERLYDPPTQAALRAGGLAAGQTVLEIGPGGGSMLRWLSAQVGPEGRVVGIDQNPRFLKDLNLPNVTVVVGDVNRTELDAAPFDLVYCRFVLLHLPDPAAALHHIRALLRPGGNLALVDMDFASHVASDPGYPSAQAFDQGRRALAQAMEEAGLMDLSFARRLPALLDEAGFADPAVAYESHGIRGGTEEASFWKQNAALNGAAGLKAGVLRQEDLAFLPVHDDPSFHFLAPLLATATARRPG